jgi:hypothetical protein
LAALRAWPRRAASWRGAGSAIAAPVTGRRLRLEDAFTQMVFDRAVEDGSTRACSSTSRAGFHLPALGQPLSDGTLSRRASRPPSSAGP